MISLYMETAKPHSLANPKKSAACLALLASPSSVLPFSPKPKTAMAHPLQFNSLLLLLFATSIQVASTSHPSSAGYVPMRAVVYRSVERAATTKAVGGDEVPGGGGRGGRYEYEPFQLCMGCRCCLAAASGNNAKSTSCVDTRCCYAIDCNVPGKPFGLCAFSSPPAPCGCGDDAGAGAGNCTATRDNNPPPPPVGRPFSY